MAKIEKIVVLSLIIAAFLGVGISYYNKVRIQDALSTDELNSAEQAQNTIARNKIININRASQYTLTKLPGIGPALAQRIINYREERGHFSSPDELINVKGIGPEKYKSIKKYIVADE